MPGDLGTRYTDRKTQEVAQRLKRLYKQAERDLDRKVSDFWTRHEARDLKYRAKLEKGLISQSDYESWLRGQVFQGNQWSAKRAQIIREMVDTDKTAQRIVDGEKQNIFIRNANYIGYSLEKDANANLGFELFDNATVTRLVRDDPDLLKPLSPKKIAEGKEIPWYQKIVTNSVTQGIIQGETVRQICDRITATCAERGETAAMRDARTAYTGAQNVGRVEAMKESEKLGVKVKKLWMAMFDDRVRDTHRDLDGQTEDVDKPFITSAGNAIMYPGDPDAAPEELYNCRCALGWSYPDYSSRVERKDMETGENVGEMTYREWEKYKKDGITQHQQDANGTEQQDKKEIVNATTREQAIHIITDVIGFYEATSGLQYIDDKTLIDNVNQLLDLNDRFQVIKNGHYGAFTTNNSNKAVASSTMNFEHPENAKLVLSTNFYGRGYQALVDYEKKMVDKKWSMPCSDDKLSVVTVTHEYGHLLQAVLIGKRVDVEAYKKEKASIIIDINKPNKSLEQQKKLYAKYSDPVAKSIFKEILDIAKRNNPDFSLRDNISNYGKTDYYEAFAETFANSQCGKPNELGKAMNEWLAKEFE